MMAPPRATRPDTPFPDATLFRSDRQHGTGAGAGAHRRAAVRRHAEAGGGHADLAAADRVDNPLPAVRAAAGDAAVGLAVRLGQRPAPVPLVRTGGHAEAVGAERDRASVG